MIGKTREVAICKWEQDFPKFMTASYRLFTLDMAAVGVYDDGSEKYKRMKAMIKGFVKLWSTSQHTTGEWEESELHKNKNILCLCFGLGDPCEKCAQHHVDIFENGPEC